MSFGALSSSLIFWEVLTFAVLLAVILWFRSRIRRRFERDTWTYGLWWPFGGQSDAARELDRRYADGEITQEEYLTTRDDITRNNDA